jgi:hypothetical protein
MYTLTYILVATIPMVMGLLAMLLGWAIGLLMADPLPTYQEEATETDTAMLDAAAALLSPFWADLSFPAAARPMPPRRLPTCRPIRHVVCQPRELGRASHLHVGAGPPV